LFVGVVRRILRRPLPVGKVDARQARTPGDRFGEGLDMGTKRGLTVTVVAIAVLGMVGLLQAQPVPPGRSPGGGPSIQPPAPPPPPPPPPSGTPQIALTEPMWVAVNGQATGPFEPRMIAEKIARREIIGETLVFTQSMNRWVRAADVAALQPLLQQAQGGGGIGGPPGIPQPPPAPPPGTNEQIQRLTNFMIGEWMVETPGHYQGITVRTQTRYFADGNFRGFQATTVAGGGGVPPNTVTRPHNGRWSVQPIDDRRFTLTLTGAQMAGSVVLEILDQNRLRNETDNYVAIRIGR
jgi:hypothetical protein